MVPAYEVLSDQTVSQGHAWSEVTPIFLLHRNDKSMTGMAR